MTRCAHFIIASVTDGMIPSQPLLGRKVDSRFAALDSDALTNWHDVIDLTYSRCIFCDFDMDDMRGCDGLLIRERSQTWQKRF